MTGGRKDTAGIPPSVHPTDDGWTGLKKSTRPSSWMAEENGRTRARVAIHRSTGGAPASQAGESGTAESSTKSSTSVVAPRVGRYRRSRERVRRTTGELDSFDESRQSDWMAYLANAAAQSRPTPRQWRAGELARRSILAAGIGARLDGAGLVRAAAWIARLDAWRSGRVRARLSKGGAR